MCINTYIHRAKIGANGSYYMVVSFPLEVEFAMMAKLNKCHFIDANRKEIISISIYFKKQRSAEMCHDAK
jgi:hypothetical protein